MTALMAFVVVIIIAALIFDYVNGFHDAANSIATVVSTRVLSPGTAVVWAAFFNFIAFAVFGTSVAKTIGGDLVEIKLIEEHWRLWVLLCGLIGAIVWNLITWYYGLPSSSSHALVGGYAGAALAAYGGFGGGLLKAAGWIKTLSFILISPTVGLLLGAALMTLIMWLCRNSMPEKVDKRFRRLQLLSAALFSLGHGGNDAQKTMGIMTAALFAGNMIAANPKGGLPEVPLWVVLSAHAAIGLGTLSGGWRIVHTMGSRITKLRPIGGFAAETAGAAAMFAATYGGIPISTTHTITGSIAGVGMTKRVSAVRWGVAKTVIWAWVLTIPMAALIAALSFYLVKFISTFVR
jgi:inorganic phosphate transporter, PiT family